MNHYDRRDVFRFCVVPWRAAAVGLACLVVGGCYNVPNRLILNDSLTGRPVQNALVLIETEEVYEAQSPLPELERENYFAKAHRKARKYGYDYYGPKHSFGPGFYYNPAAYEGYPFPRAAFPAQVRLMTISSGWKIFYEDSTLTDEYQPSFLAKVYYVLKPGFLPVRLDVQDLKNLVSSHRQAVVSMRVEKPGTLASDRTILNAAEDVLGLLPRPDVQGEMRYRLLLYLAEPLRHITDFPPTSADYPEFSSAQLLARKSLDRIHELAPSIPAAQP